jgi:hypothetical protein
MLSIPFNYRLHGFPHDYRRLTSSGVYWMLDDFPQKFVFAIGPRMKPTTVFAVAARTETQTFEARQQRFRSAIQAESGMLRRRLFWSALEERARDLVGLVLGRADVSIAFYDPTQEGGYKFELNPGRLDR